MGLVLESQKKQHVEYDAGRGQESLSGAGTNMQDANGKLSSQHRNR